MALSLQLAFNKYILSACYVIETILSAKDTVMTVTICVPKEIKSLVGRTDK